MSAPEEARPTVIPFRRPVSDKPRTPARPRTSMPNTPPPEKSVPGKPQPEPIWRELAGKVLRDERNRQQRTLGQVAQRAGISSQYLSEVERGRKEPSSEMLASICGALGLTLADLLGGGLQFIRLGSATGPGAGTHPRPGSMPSGPVLMAVG